MGPLQYIVVDYDDETIGVFDNIEGARECISERVEEGSDIEGWRIFEAREISFRVTVVVEQIERANVDTDLDHGSKPKTV